MKGRGIMRVVWVGEDYCPHTDHKVGFAEDGSGDSIRTAPTPKKNWLTLAGYTIALARPFLPWHCYGRWLVVAPSLGDTTSFQDIP